MNKPATKLFYLACVTLLLAWGVIQLGAYTRLTDAGLGCPDWPGCYGHFNVAHVSSSKLHQTLIATRQAWTEMVHRYLAGSLIALILILFAALLRRSKQLTRSIRVTMLLLTTIIVLQALLGMWTVTEKLHPTIVTAHLLGGMSLVGLLTWLTCALKSTKLAKENTCSNYCFLVWIGIGLVLFQISLGGWTSSNYAALACSSFPSCNGLWRLPTDLHAAFPIFTGLGINYQGGVFAIGIRMTIHLVHRYGAFILASYLLLMSAILYIKENTRAIRVNILLVIAILSLQVVLGIINVLYLLPLPIAVAHNACAALLLMSLVILCYQLTRLRECL